MSKQRSFVLAVAVLAITAALRLVGLASLPPGMNMLEAQDVQIAELIRFGQVEVFYEVGVGGREGLYHVLVSAFTAFVGNHPFGYRLVSVWAGLLAIALIYTLTRRLYGRFVGLVAMAAFAVPLWSLLLSRLITREALLPLIVTSVLMAFARALPVYRRPNLNPSTLPFAVLGFVLGLGFYVHPAHYVVVLAGMVFIAYMVLTRQPMSRRTLSYLSFTIVILIIVATPYMIAALRLPALGGAARLSAVFDQVASAGVLTTLGGSLMGFFVRGDTHILHNLPGRPYMDPLSGLLILWGMGVSIRRFQEPRYALPLVMLTVLLPVALLAPQSPNFMSYVVILPLIAIFFALGAKRAAKSFPRKEWGGVAVLLLLLTNLLWSVQGLATWTQLEDVQSAYHARVYAIAQYLDETVSGTATVVCAPTLPTYPTWLASPDNPATLLPLMMANPDANQIRYADCGSGMIFTNGGEHQQLIVLEEGALDDFHPYVRDWVQRGDLIQAGVPMQSVVSMVVDDTLGDTIGRFTTTAPAGFAPESPGGVAAAPLPIGFEGNLTFLGYDRADLDNVYAPGDIVTVITYWRVDGRLEDLNLFAHMLFDAETLVTQTDTISVQPQRLQARDVFVQITFITLPETLPEGTYQISIGAYHPDNDLRLAVLDRGRPRGTRLFLNEVQIAPPVDTANSSGED